MLISNKLHSFRNFKMQNTVKTAIRNSRINFYFVTAFYSLYDICMADSGRRPN